MVVCIFGGCVLLVVFVCLTYSWVIVVWVWCVVVGAIGWFVCYGLYYCVLIVDC